MKRETVPGMPVRMDLVCCIDFSGTDCSHGVQFCAMSRRLAAVTAIVFLVSLVFPFVASLSHNAASFPKWWGVLDVGVASVLAILALVVLRVTQGKISKEVEHTTYRIYRILVHGIFLMLVVFFLFGDHIVWSNCLTGFAWRSWLLLYTLPAWLTAASTTTSKP